MAAPSNRQHVRLKLTFQGVSLEPTWLFIEFSKFKTIDDIHTAILSRHFPDKPCKLKLFLHDCVLPVTENCLILENNDAITVDCQEFHKGKNDSDHHKVKSKKKKKRDASSEEITSYDEVDPHEVVTKQKKKKKKHSKISPELSIQHESMQMDDTIHLGDKHQSLKEVVLEDENVLMKEVSRPADKDMSNKRSQNRDERESEQLRKKVCSNKRESPSLNVAPVAEDMEEVPVSCSTPDLDIEDTVEMANASAGTGSEVLMDTEHKAKRKRRKRKRKTHSPGISSTKPLYKSTEQCLTSVNNNRNKFMRANRDTRKHQAGGKHVHFGSDDSGDEPSENDETTTAHAIPDTNVTSAMLKADFHASKQDEYKEGLYPDSINEAPLKQNHTADVGDSYTSQPFYVDKEGDGIPHHVNQNSYNADILSPHNSNAGVYIMASDSLSGPTVINELFSAKQSSPIVFTRPRQKKYRAFSKEEQLNSSSTNRSIIIQNPADDDRAASTEPIEVTAIPITVDYQRFPVLQGFPRKWDNIAYKDLVLNETYEPVLSDFKEAIVLGFDSISKNVDLEIKRQTETPRKHGKFDVMVEDDTGSLTNIPTEAEKIQIHWGAIKDVRLMT